MQDEDEQLHLVIFSADPESAEPALHELRRVDASVRLQDWLAPGIGLLRTNDQWESFSSRVRADPPIFCRHICPAQVSVAVERTADDPGRIASAAERLLPLLDISLTISVQTRILEGDRPYGSFEVNECVADLLQSMGASIDVRRPLQVLSVVSTADRAYLGLSMASENLSDWAGGARRFKREAGQVSRAEFKLMEALELFEIEPKPGGLALDLGAAPGGWTRVLRSRGMRVVAVDPAGLHPSIESDPQVLHRREVAQVYLPTKERFDLIVNDMRMDARDSSRLMLAASDALKPEGVAVMTLKLPLERTLEVASASIQILSKRYEVVGARQLFHNRSEITVVLRRKLRG